MSRWLLDSYALLAYYQNEEAAARVGQLIADPESDCWMSVINLGEVYYKLIRVAPLLSTEEFLSEIDRLPVALVDVDRSMALSAGRIKAKYPMSYADCYAAALGQQLGARVVTGDPEFEQVERAGIVEVEWLPRPRRR